MPVEQTDELLRGRLRVVFLCVKLADRVHKLVLVRSAEIVDVLERDVHLLAERV